MESTNSAVNLGVKLFIVFLVILALAYLATGTIDSGVWSSLQRLFMTLSYICATVYTIFSHKSTN